jgi:hypothetical protein
MTTRTAACACGELRARTDGEPTRLSVCHCLDCKRRSGSAFSWNATFNAGQVAVEGEYRTWQRGADDDRGWARHHFCPICGNEVFYEIEVRPGMISIPAGAFADKDLGAPEVEVYGERRCPWLSTVAGAEQT